jgi:hypothetical protein
MTERAPVALTRFSGADAGPWRITSIRDIRGATLPPASFLAINGQAGAWTLSGASSNLRYTTAPERTALRAKQEGLGRPTSTRAALIPIRKSEEWWAMAQDERRAVYERGGHLPIGLDYLPGVARKLSCCRFGGHAV